MLETGILPFSHLKIEDWFDLDSVLIKQLHFPLTLYIEYIIFILSSHGILGSVGETVAAQPSNCSSTAGLSLEIKRRREAHPGL